MNTKVLEIKSFSKAYKDKHTFISNIKYIAENFVNHFQEEPIYFEYEEKLLFANFFSLHGQSNNKTIFSFEFMENYSLNLEDISILFNYNETSVMNIFNALLYYKNNNNIKDENIDSFLFNDSYFRRLKTSSLMINRIIFKSLYQFLDQTTSEILFSSRMESLSLNISNLNNELNLNYLEVSFVTYSKNISALKFSIILDLNFNISKICIGSNVFSVHDYSIEQLKKYFIVKLYSFIDFDNLNILNFDDISLENFEEYYEIYKIKKY